MNSSVTKIGFWPTKELSNLFYVNSSGSVEAIYQGSTGSELTILMNYENNEQQVYTIPLAHVLMYTLWEEQTGDEHDRTNDNSGA